MASSLRAPIKLRHALGLGLAQGPTELLPVSSSAHTTLIPLLLNWPYEELDGELRKSFELALHAGAGLALALDMGRELVPAVRLLDRRRLTVVALSLAPAALAGLALRPWIERRLGGPPSIAAGLALGGLAMAGVERRVPLGRRSDADTRAADGLALGLAQAVALAPGVSRYGATLVVARMRHFSPEAAQTLSWHAALPVVLGASALEGARLVRRGTPDGAPAPLTVGAIAAFASTLLSARLLRRPERALRSLLPWALYRVALAALVLARSLRPRTAKPSSNP
ncbi:MAG: undecaprenyl-diphosphatase [Solirubrobacteraceae bacterium]|nr:undecaprenyl-diphosphatase [Solirubrobacteraceae bacterium]